MQAHGGSGETVPMGAFMSPWVAVVRVPEFTRDSGLWSYGYLSRTSAPCLVSLQCEEMRQRVPVKRQGMEVTYKSWWGIEVTFELRPN